MNLRTDRKSYEKKGKNYTAVTRLATWLDVARIPYRLTNEGPHDLIVECSNGGPMPVRVSLVPENGGPDHYSVSVQEMINRNDNVSTAAFARLTAAAGYGRVNPLVRCASPLSKKLNTDDHFELVAMRHTEFRRVPNPTNQQLESHKTTIDKAINRAQSIHYNLFARNGLDKEDLRTYAQIWTCNFLGLYNIKAEGYKDNERKLYAYLCQRFSNFCEAAYRKERSVVPDMSTYYMAILGKPWVATKFGPDHLSGFSEDGESIQLDEQEFSDSLSSLEEDPEEACQVEINPAKRRANAKACLAAELGRMPHDKLLESLYHVLNSSFFCHDAKAEARRQLKKHQKGCRECSTPK